MRPGMEPPQAPDTSESEHERGRAARGRGTRNRLRVPQQGRRSPHRAVRACWRRLDLSTASAISLSLEPPYRSPIRVVNLPPDTAAKCGGRTTTTCRFLAEAPPLGCAGQRGSKHGLRLAEIAARRAGRVGRVHCSVSCAGLSTQMTQCGCRQRVHAFNPVCGGARIAQWGSALSELRIQPILHVLGGAQYGTRFVLGFLPFRFRHRISDDAGGGLRVQVAAVDHAGADCDRQIHLAGK